MIIFVCFPSYIIYDNISDIINLRLSILYSYRIPTDDELDYTQFAECVQMVARCG